jgi:hypothetical protein
VRHPKEASQHCSDTDEAADQGYGVHKTSNLTRDNSSRTQT